MEHLYITIWITYTLVGIIGMNTYFQRMIKRNKGVDALMLLIWILITIVGLYTCIEHFNL